MLFQILVLQAIQLDTQALLVGLTNGVLDTAPWKEEDESQITGQPTMR